MKYIALILTYLSVSILSVYGQDQMPPWQEGWMDIHTVATGAGESTFIIMPDGTTMMIDAGDVTNNTKEHDYPNFMDDPQRTVAGRLAEYVMDFSAGLPHPQRLDYFLLTHFHKDHMGQAKGMTPGKNGYGLSGITELGEYVGFNTIVDRGWPEYDSPSKEKVESFNPGFMEEYRKFLQYQIDAKSSSVEQFRIGDSRQFVLKHQPEKYDFKIWNVAASGIIDDGAGGVRSMYPSDADETMFDENTNSCVVVFRYGPFKYYNGGDVCGRAVETGNRRKIDCESHIADLCGPITVVKTDHHGYKDSCNPYFLWKTKPQAVVIPAFGGTHPWIETLRRLTDPHYKIKGIYATTRSAEKICKEEMNGITAFGHIVVRVYEGGKKWQIYVLDLKDKGYKVLHMTDVMELE